MGDLRSGGLGSGDLGDSGSAGRYGFGSAGLSGFRSGGPGDAERGDSRGFRSDDSSGSRSGGLGSGFGQADEDAGGSGSRRARSGSWGSSERSRGSGRGARASDGLTPGDAGRPRSEAEKAQSEAERAREICLRQLSVRPRTRAELAKALAKKEISDEVIAEVLDRYGEVGIIDDAAFAHAWVASRHQGRGLAKRALANELRQHGVDSETASEALETLDEDDEASTARALVDKKLRTATGAPDAVFRRLVAMLARKGYPAGIAFRAVKDAIAARDAEFADSIDPDALADGADPQF